MQRSIEDRYRRTGRTTRAAGAALAALATGKSIRFVVHSHDMRAYVSRHWPDLSKHIVTVEQCGRGQLRGLKLDCVLLDHACHELVPFAVRSGMWDEMKAQEERGCVIG